MNANNMEILPSGLPIPVDDGGCDHLLGMSLPNVSLSSSAGELINLSLLTDRYTVIYFFPMAWTHHATLPANWNDIPGARGCTPQSCSFRDRIAELVAHDARVIGISTQPQQHLEEIAERLHLAYPLLSDSELILTSALRLPTFQAGPATFLKRLTIIVSKNTIQKTFYPVFPPNENVSGVLSWLHAGHAHTDRS